MLNEFIRWSRHEVSGGRKFPASHRLRTSRSWFRSSLWVSEDSSGSADEDVLARCAKHSLILLTLDKDFGELVFRRGLPAGCGVILFRIDAQSPQEFTEIALTALRSRDDWDGFFTVVESDRIRMRPLTKR